MTQIMCRPRALSPAQALEARRRAIEINPSNAALRRQTMRTPIGRIGGRRRLTLIVGRRWPVTGVELTVQFLDNPEKALRTRILLHMNAWGTKTNVAFRETRGAGHVRIARLDHPEEDAGYWSYVGTEILGIKVDRPTMNLEGFTMDVSEAEFKRVVRHETGHTLGFDHEHMRGELVRLIDVKKAIRYYDRTEGWTADETRAQVLMPLSKKTIMGTTEADPTSIMCYQVPGEITKTGKPIPGGRDINAKDYAFAASIYPKAIKSNAPRRAKRSGK